MASSLAKFLTESYEGGHMGAGGNGEWSMVNGKWSDPADEESGMTDG